MITLLPHPTTVSTLRRLATIVTLLYLATLLAVTVGVFGIVLGGHIISYLAALVIVLSLGVLVLYVGATAWTTPSTVSDTHQSLTDGARGYTSKVA